MKTRQPKSVSFNLADEYELKLLKHAEKKEHGNFSRYIKRLIAMDMEGRQTRQVAVSVQSEVNDDEKDAMKGFL